MTDAETDDPQDLARKLCAMAVAGSPDRKAASVRLMAAAATLAVTEQADLKQWISACVSTLDMTKRAYAADRRGIRMVAGLPVIEAV